jgi:type IV pilus assembly protein PilB
MAVPQPKITTLAGLARKVVEYGLLTPEQAEEAFNQSLKERKSFVTYVVENKLISNCRELALAAAEEFGWPVVDIDTIDLNPDTIKKIDEKLLKKHKALPIFERGKRLFVAVSDPTNLPALDEIRFHTKMNTEPVVVEEDKLAKVIERALEVFDTSMKDLGGDLDVDLVDEDAEAKAGADDKSEAEEAPIIKFVNKMFYDAIKMGASDLHFEPYEKFFRVRFRVDGMLRIVATPPVGLSRKLAARLKVMARLDISEKRVPQDGRIKIKYGKGSIDFRVSTMPTLFGEKIVLRILDSSAANLDIDKLGYEAEQKQLYLEALSNPYGMVLVTGPTGSGKTVSLYTGINILNQEDVNISTAEDPVEINLPGVNQVQVDEKTGMSFAKALKAFLRQDPDIILVGEIRDLETGGIAIKAATTGHMVMSTLHTNDAPATLTRMVDMGIPTFAIATAVNLIMAQRLCRRLCTCKIEHKDVPDKILHQEGFKKEDLDKRAKGEWKLYTKNPDGCERCNKLGFKGRVGIYQVMPISEAMKRLIMGGSNAIGIADQAILDGIPDLRKSGLKKIMDGFTSLEEVNRVVNKAKEKDE